MSSLKKLIKGYCPNGVKYLTLGEIANEINIGINPRKFFKLNPDNAEGFYVTVRELNGLQGVKQHERTDTISLEAVAIINDRAHIEKGDILFSNTGTVGKLALVSEKPQNWGVNEGIYVIKPRAQLVNPRFLYYYLDSDYAYNDYSKKFTGSTLKHVTQKALSLVKIPVPPLEVQREIVRILDNFTLLTAELTAELEKRIKQCEEISARLFDSIKQSSKKYVLSDICKIEKGNTPIQKAISGDYPLVVTTSERKTNNTFQFEDEAVCIPLVSSRGHGVASLNHVYYQNGKFALGTILCAIIPKEPANVSAKFLYYYFEQTKEYSLVPLMKGGANVALHISDIEKIKVPIPSREEQQIIIDQLDILNHYCNVYLPKEIEDRQMQYRYYRDNILRFNEKIE